MSITIAPQYTQRSYYWTAWKAANSKKGFTLQWEETTEEYTIWGYDGPEAHICTIYKGEVPPVVVESGYSQVTNDTDKANFEASFKATGNLSLTPAAAGVPLTRGIVTKAGWHFEPRAIKWATATNLSLHNKKADGFSVTDGTDFGDAVLKFYKSDGVPLIKFVDESDAAFQVRLDAKCTCTIMDWQPTYDMDIRSGRVSIITDVTDPTYVYVVAAPDLPAIYGGNVPFFAGGLDLRFISGKSVIAFDGSSAKLVAYDPVYLTNKFRIKMVHGTGAKILFQVIFEHYKA